MFLNSVKFLLTSKSYRSLILERNCKYKLTDYKLQIDSFYRQMKCKWKENWKGKATDETPQCHFLFSQHPEPPNCTGDYNDSHHSSIEKRAEIEILLKHHTVYRKC